MNRFVLLPVMALALAVNAFADSDGILAYDDFSGSAGDLNGRKTPRGQGDWFTNQNLNALVLDGKGHAVMHPDTKSKEGRKYAWLEVAPEGEEYYVAARLSYDGTGWGAIGFSGPNRPKEPLLASALFAVREGAHGGVGFIWIDNEARGDERALMHRIPEAARYRSGEPGTIAVSYNSVSGSLRFLYNGQVVYQAERFDLPVGRAVVAFITDQGANPDGSFIDSIVVANKEVEMPAE